MDNVRGPRAGRFFHDADGNLVVAQAPNPPLIGWMLCAVAALLVPDGAAASGLGHLGRAFLFTWAYLEITDGANHFRRLLGLVAMVSVVVGFFKS